MIQAHKVDAARELRDFVSLTSLRYGNDHPGSDKSVVLPDLEWVLPLQNLQTLELPGIRLVDPDLTPLMRLGRLSELRLPLRRDLRSQVFEFAATSRAFTQVAREFEEYEAWSADLERVIDGLLRSRQTRPTP